MKRSLFQVFAAITVLIATSFTIANAGQFNIDSVAVKGNRRIDSAAIKQQLKKTSGEITDGTVSEDIKTLYKTGFFDQVSASIDRGDKTVLTYTVVEKPIVRKVFIKGNEELKESDLTDVFSFGTKRFLDKSKLESLNRAGVTYYQSRGYYDAAVKYSVVPVDDNQVDVTFAVTEGARYKIREIDFRGLDEISESDLRSTIETKRYKWWNSWLFGTGRLNKDALDNDKNLLRQYFLDNGFLDANISDPTIDKSNEKLTIVFDVKEGPQYKVGKISATGDLVNKSIKDTLEGTAISSGDTFSASKVREDSFVVSEKFSDEGYAFVNVVPDTHIEKVGDVVNLEYNISKGKKVKVDKIIVKGNEKTYENVIRRELKIDEQDIYSTAKIKRSEALLKRLGYFEEANIGTEPIPGKDDEVNLGVNVREASTGSFSVGAGYSDSDGALANARITENNIFGTGKRVDLNLEYGEQRDNITLTVEDPRLFDTYVSGSVDALKTDRQFLDFDRSLAGGGATLGYPLEQVFGENFQDINASFRYEYLAIDINNLKDDVADFVRQSAGSSTSSSVTPQLTRNTIDNPLNPTKGSKQVLSTEVAGAGGNEKFYLVEAKNQWYQPLFDPGFGPFVFSWRTTADYGDSLDNDPFPLFRRFFPGGINSVRGYKARTLGPKDDRGNEFGGSKQLINNFETIFPLVNSAGLRGVVFYDAGQAFDDNKSITLSELRTAYGAGIRWASPLGPIRLEFGFPISPKEGENDKMVTLFSFGAPF